MLSEQAGRPCMQLVGVPQGSVAGPTLFLIYIDDLLSRINRLVGVSAYLFADDLTVLIKCLNNEKGMTIAQRALNIISNWASENKMKVSAPKSEVITFTLSSHTDSGKTKLVLKIDGETIKEAVMGSEATVKILGIPMGMRFDVDPILTFTSQWVKKHKS
eukprot:Tbor_TRINITY_DN5705_c1_g1::TRINITY_DN5705_c1_g1_i1::g.20595::m.20595